MNLLIDIGNQRIKWATSDQINARINLQRESSENLKSPGWVVGNQVMGTHDRNFEQRISAQFNDFNDLAPDSVWVSSVSGEGINTEMDKFFSARWNLSAVYAVAQSNAFGIRNCYENPELLGVDRWLAIIGGRHIAGPGPLVIIDAGTAVTIDYVNDQDNFLGGVICPGFGAIIVAINSSAGLIREEIQLVDKKCLQFTNTNTHSAMANGAALSVVAGIDQAIDYYLSADGEELRVLITGGDAESISGLSCHGMDIEPNLVLVGLMLLSGETGN